MMFEPGKPSYAVYDRSTKQFVYAAYGEAQYTTLPKWSSISGDLPKAKALLDRYQWYLDKSVEDAKRQVTELIAEGPLYKIYSSRADAKKYHAQKLVNFRKCIVEAEALRKRADFVVVELSLQVV